MPNKTRPYHERFRYDVVGIYVSMAITVLGLFVFSQYTQGWTWALASPSIWALIGLASLAVSFIAWGMISSFRQRTRKLFSDNYVFEFPHKEPIRVTTRHYLINEDVLVRVLPSSEIPDIRAAVQYQQGRLGTAGGVAVSAYAVGGFDAHGFHSIDIGQQGYI